MRVCYLDRCVWEFVCDVKRFHLIYQFQWSSKRHFAFMLGCCCNSHTNQMCKRENYVMKIILKAYTKREQVCIYKRRNILHAIKVFYVYFMTLMLPFLPPLTHTKLYIFFLLYLLILYFCILQYFWIYNIYARLMECSWRDKNFFSSFLSSFSSSLHFYNKKCQEWRGKVFDWRNFLIFFAHENWMKIFAVIIGSLALSMIYIVTMERISNY